MAQLLNTTIKGLIQSANYVLSKYGWSISKIGDAEFNSVKSRGIVEAEEVHTKRVVFVKPLNYETRVARNVELKYTIEDEIALLRRKLAGDPTVEKQFQEYHNYVENAKISARNDVGR